MVEEFKRSRGWAGCAGGGLEKEKERIAKEAQRLGAGREVMYVVSAML